MLNGFSVPIKILSSEPLVNDLALLWKLKKTIKTTSILKKDSLADS